jgi:photosystem II stability/assembly factor-like uncharacterized protein
MNMKTRLLKTNQAILKVKYYCFLIATLGGFFSAGAQTWGMQSSLITDDINGIAFSKSVNTGFAVAMGGRILKTTNSGNTWVLQNSGTVNDLYAVCFSGNSMDTGYVVGDSGLVLMTTNGGTSWSTLTSGVTSQLNDISVKKGEGYIVGNDGVILQLSGTTINTMNSNTTNDLYSVYMFDATSAYVVGGGILSATLLVTYNSGNVWTSVSTGAATQLNDVFAVNDSTFYVVGNAGTIRRTTNFGANWTSQYTGFTNINAVYFINEDSGYAVGATGTLLRTTNGGDTWVTSVSGTTSELNDVAFTDAYRGYAAGNGGTIIRTCPTVQFDMSPGDSVCIHSTVDFTNQSKNSNSYVWLKEGDTVSTNTNYTHDFDTVGSYTIRLVADNGTCQSSLTQTVRVADEPEVDLGPDTSICSTCTIVLDAGNIGSTYKWYRNGVATGVVSRTNTVGVAGMYSVKVENGYGCTSWDSVEVSISTAIKEFTANISDVEIYPNPNHKVFAVDFTVLQKQQTAITIVNMIGDIVYTQNLTDFSGNYSGKVSLESFAPGVYFLTVQSGQSTQVRKIITY